MSCVTLIWLNSKRERVSEREIKVKERAKPTTCFFLCNQLAPSGGRCLFLL